MTGIVIPDGGTIGSASDTDAIAISSGGNVTLSQTLDGGAIGSAVTMSANQACVKTALNASGSAPIYACRAWVNFNGTSGSGTGNSDITIRASGNVSSITDNGTGLYTVNFTTPMADSNYSVACAGSRDNTSSIGACIISARSGTTGYNPYNTGSVAISCLFAHASQIDGDFINISIFR